MKTHHFIITLESKKIVTWSGQADNISHGEGLALAEAVENSGEQVYSMERTKSIPVLKRANWKDRSAAPCTMVDEYSTDGGDTWISRAEFHQWHDSLIEVVNTYPSAKVSEE